MEIVKASIRDLGALRRLENEVFKKDAWPLLDLIAVLTFGNVIRLKAVDGGTMIGFIAGDPRPSSGWGWIATIAVDPPHQRRGIGRSLLRECETLLGVPRARLTVRMSNQPAISLYENEGYTTMDIWKNYYDDGEDAILMEKNL